MCSSDLAKAKADAAAKAKADAAAKAKADADAAIQTRMDGAAEVKQEQPVQPLGLQNNNPLSAEEKDSLSGIPGLATSTVSRVTGVPDSSLPHTDAAELAAAKARAAYQKELREVGKTAEEILRMEEELKEGSEASRTIELFGNTDLTTPTKPEPFISVKFGLIPARDP
mgnify:CR=1 FL=1